MRPIVLYSIFFVCYSLVSLSVYAQTEVDERAVIRFDKGLGFHSPDTTFGVNIRFRMQNRVGFGTVSERDLNINEVDARIRRLRLRFDGYTSSQKLTYYIQLSFSRGDQDWDNSGVPNVIRDAMVYYNFNPNFYIGFGQGKLPGNRQRIISSGEQQFTDRSIVNNTFNIDRDFGVMAYYSNNIGKVHYNLKTALSSGEGRNALASDNGIAYTGRIEILPFGKFTNNNDFSEGDQKHELTPKLSIAAGYSFNHMAQRANGQRGAFLHESRDLKNLYFDVLFKYMGWAVYTEFMEKRTEDPITIAPTPDQKNIYVYTGYGYLTQLSYYFKNKIEIGGRYSSINPTSQISAYESRTNEYALGLTKYLYSHKVKLQSNLIYQQKGNITPLTGSKDRWFLHFQVELGI
jgi:phosphate-selective porin OprO and OprP